MDLTPSAPRKLALITGAAEGLGVSVAGALAATGYDVVGIARSDRAEAAMTAGVCAAGGRYLHLACDIADADRVAKALAPFAERTDVVVHNAHRLVIAPFAEIEPEDFVEAWRVACLGAMTVSRVVLPCMAARGRGTVVFTGATASRRGAAGFAAFASAKFALRGLAQALAREYGPKGVHVAHLVVDGLIKGPQSERRFAPAPSSCLEPEAVAETCLALIAQPRSAWTFELDLRPSSERF